MSGSDTSTVLKKIGNFKKLPEPRKAVLRKLYDPKVPDCSKNSLIDHGIVMWFPGEMVTDSPDAFLQSTEIFHSRCHDFMQNL